MKVYVRKNIWRFYRYLGRAIKWSKINEIRMGKTTTGSLVDRMVRHLLLKREARTAALPGTSIHLTDVGPDTLEMAFGIYEPLTTNIFRTALSEGMTVVDIGAHVGYYTLLAAKEVGPRGCVYAFEPHPQTFRALQRNLDLNACENVIPLPYAVSDFNGEAPFYAGHSSMEHSLHARDSASPSMKVRSLTLDSFFSCHGWPKVDLIKMDIEGGESAALRGSEATIKRSKPILIIEFWAKHLASAGVSPQHFLLQLRHLGFSILALDESSLKALPIESFENLRGQFGNKWEVNLVCKKGDTDIAPELLGRLG